MVLKKWYLIFIGGKCRDLEKTFILNIAHWIFFGFYCFFTFSTKNSIFLSLQFLLQCLIHKKGTGYLWWYWCIIFAINQNTVTDMIALNYFNWTYKICMIFNFHILVTWRINVPISLKITCDRPWWPLKQNVDFT